jgi:hypothetical protein
LPIASVVDLATPCLFAPVLDGSALGVGSSLKQCFKDLAKAPMLLFFAQRMIAKAIGLPLSLTLGGKALAASGGHTKTAADLGSGFLV